MAQVRPLKELGRRYLLINGVLTGLCIASALFVFFRQWRSDGWLFAAIGIMVATSLGAWLVDRVMIRRIRCPQCGRVLPREVAPRGKLITVQYHCRDCDVIWDTAGTPDREYSDSL